MDRSLREMHSHQMEKKHIVHCVLLAAHVAASLDQLCLTSGRRQGGREVLLYGHFNS